MLIDANQSAIENTYTKAFEEPKAKMDSVRNSSSGNLDVSYLKRMQNDAVANFHRNSKRGGFPLNLYFIAFPFGRRNRGRRNRM